MAKSSQVGGPSAPYLQQLRMLSNYEGHTLYVDFNDLLQYDNILALAIEDQYYRYVSKRTSHSHEYECFFGWEGLLTP